MKGVGVERIAGGMPLKKHTAKEKKSQNEEEKAKERQRWRNYFVVGVG